MHRDPVIQLFDFGIPICLSLQIQWPRLILPNLFAFEYPSVVEIGISAVLLLYISGTSITRSSVKIGDELSHPKIVI